MFSMGHTYLFFGQTGNAKFVGGKVCYRNSTLDSFLKRLLFVPQHKYFCHFYISTCMKHSTCNEVVNAEPLITPIEPSHAANCYFLCFKLGSI